MKIMNEGYDSKYCYTTSNVLINKKGIKDKEKLQKFERITTTFRLLDLKNNPIKGNFDLKHLLNIHKYIFSDVYEWAGKIRSVDIAKGNLFCKASFIQEMSEEIFGKLEEDHFLIGLSQNDIIPKLSYYFGEINALHPFREGNGRTQREFIKCLSRVAGYDIKFDKVNSDRLMEASIDTFECKYEKMNQVFSECIEKITYEEQVKKCMLIFTTGGKGAKIFKEYSK